MRTVSMALLTAMTSRDRYQNALVSVSALRTCHLIYATVNQIVNLVVCPRDRVHDRWYRSGVRREAGRPCPLKKFEFGGVFYSDLG